MPTPLTTPQNTDDAVIVELELASPPETVFAALTDPEQLSEWWDGADQWEVDLRHGGQWRGWGECQGKVSAVHGEYVEIQEPKVLTYTWITDHGHEPASLVRWELQPTDLGTRVKLTHSGFGANEQTRKGYVAGWQEVMRDLRQYLRMVSS